MTHIKYPKIRRFGTEETDWIMQWEITVQEKIDWANLSVRLEDWEMFVWSRTKIVWDKEKKEWFNGAVEYINNHKWIRKLLEDNPTYRLYGERLVQHTVRYNPELYRKFWMYDILTEHDWEEYYKFLSQHDVSGYASIYDIESPKIFYNWKVEDIQEWDIEKRTKETPYWDKTEWVVIKNVDFVNKYWRNCYAKKVLDSFKEENQIVFWGWQNKYEDKEINIAHKYCTAGRFMKLVHKLEQNQWKNFTEKNIWEIIWRMNYDILEEEFKTICKWVVDFKILNKTITRLTRIMCLQYLDWSHAFNLNKERNEESNNV